MREVFSNNDQFLSFLAVCDEPQTDAVINDDITSLLSEGVRKLTKRFLWSC